MFYEPAKGHGLPHAPFQACVVPRPIGWISTESATGVANLAPFSYYNAVLTDPPMVMFSTSAPSDRRRLAKDTLLNVRETGEFVVNVVGHGQRDAMNESSVDAARDVDEFALLGIARAPSRLVRPPRVKAAPIHLECTLYTIVDLPGAPNGNAIVIGTVVGVHIDDAVLTGGLVDMAKLRPLARLGYLDYAEVVNVFPMARPRRKA